MNKRQLIGVLRRAKWRLERYGWIRGAWGSPRMGYCVIGAIDASTRSVAMQTEARWPLRQTLHLDYNDIVSWNDAPRRTKDQVLRAFDRTIKRLEKEASK